MKPNKWTVMLSLLLISSTNMARDTLSIEQAANWVSELGIEAEADHQQLSVSLNQISAKDALPIVQTIENLQSALVSGNGNSHQYVQSNFMQNKNQQSLVPKAHLIDHIFNNNQLNIPFKSFNDELLTLHWQHNNSPQQTTNLYATWLINLEKGNQFTEKTSALTSIRPLISPSLLVKGNDFPVRLYHQFGVLEDHQIHAMHINSKQQVMAVSDDQGIAVIHLSQAGDWLLMLQHQDLQQETVTTSYALLSFHVNRGEQ